MIVGVSIEKCVDILKVAVGPHPKFMVSVNVNASYERRIWFSL